ncbi:hypothetical protein [Pyxidicoccus xibeiensis]|uniref:hypothetical protein n=1 Tax=Pyxidicoccus xibeiensis TaxID=2906759 RepID=UPI0020A82A99|nr:hypothetical protein [Pyxidicoccus xibeiensis]MCP3135851.1 hypothetical protein [Pyxidicoccus xibeiensis]
MRRWRAGTVGLALGVWTALGCGAVDGALEPITGPFLEEERPEPELVSGPQSGTPRWTVQVPLRGYQDVLGVGSDGAGGAIVLATNLLTDASSSDSRDFGGLVLSRFGVGGQPLWTRTFTPEQGPDGSQLIQDGVLAVSPARDLFVAGTLQGESSLRFGETVLIGTAFVAKLAHNGVPRWIRPGAAHALAADEQGGVVLMTRDGTVTRLDSEGRLRWQWVAPDATYSLSAVAVDTSGGVLVAGERVLGPERNQGALFRLYLDGSERWRILTPEGPGRPTFTDVALRPDGGVLLTGTFVSGFQWGRTRMEHPCASTTGCSAAPFLLAVEAFGEPQWGRVLDSSGSLDGAMKPRVAGDRHGGAAVSWGNACLAKLLRVSHGGEELWQSQLTSESCTGSSASLRDLTFLEDGDLMSAGTFHGTHSFIGTGDLKADDGDIFLQRLIP